MNNEALQKLSENLPKTLTTEQSENLTFLLQTMSGDVEGMDENMLGPYRPTFLRLFQKSSTDEAAPDEIRPGDLYADGVIYYEAKNSDSEGIYVVPLLGWKSHQRWPMGEERPDCWSNDAKYSAVTDMPCANCPDFPWKDGQRQDCRDIYNWVMLLSDMSTLFHIQFRGTSTKVGKTIARFVQRQGRGTAWKVQFKLTTQEQQKGSNKWHVYKASMSKPPGAALQDVAETLGRSLSAARDELLQREQDRREATGGAKVIEAQEDDIDM